jgi:hypothetical protein
MPAPILSRVYTGSSLFVLLRTTCMYKAGLK